MKIWANSYARYEDKSQDKLIFVQKTRKSCHKKTFKNLKIKSLKKLFKYMKNKDNAKSNKAILTHLGVLEMKIHRCIKVLLFKSKQFA